MPQSFPSFPGSLPGPASTPPFASSEPKSHTSSMVPPVQTVSCISIAIFQLVCREFLLLNSSFVALCPRGPGLYCLENKRMQVFFPTVGRENQKSDHVLAERNHATSFLAVPSFGPIKLQKGCNIFSASWKVAVWPKPTVFGMSIAILQQSEADGMIQSSLVQPIMCSIRTSNIFPSK